MSAQTRTDAQSLCAAGLEASTAPGVTPAARCRYKTGRCTNPRVVKANGTLLLLCEYHRCQQNRTKKRSDMKYRQHRAAKRQLERAAQYSRPQQFLKRGVASTNNSLCRAVPDSLVQQDFEPHGPRTRNRVVAPAAIQTGWLDEFAPIEGVEPSSCSVFRRNWRHTSAESRINEDPRIPFGMTSTSPTTVTDFDSAVSPWPAHDCHEIQTSLSPLVSSPQEWLPDELELLEYFIMS